MKVFVVMYGIGWPEDGDGVAGVYTTRELAEAAQAKDARAWLVFERELDAEPVFTG